MRYHSPAPGHRTCAHRILRTNDQAVGEQKREGKTETACVHYLGVGLEACSIMDD